MAGKGPLTRCARFVVLLLFSICILIFSGVYAQQSPVLPLNEKSELLAFDVASVKLARHDESMQIVPTTDGFVARSVLITQLIWFAYHSTNASEPSSGIVKPEQIADLPAWTMKARYDVDAKLPPEKVAPFQKLRAEQRRQILQQALASLLADRFKLRVHYESRNGPVYQLTVKDPSMLKESPPTPNMCMMTWGSDFMDFRDCSIDQLSLRLSENENLGRIVVNKTGLSGIYELHLKWTPYEEEASESGLSLFPALEEQLGLKLVSAKAPINKLVVDSIETPSQN